MEAGIDDQLTGSVGDVAVSPSNLILYNAASGEGIQRPTWVWGRYLPRACWPVMGLGLSDRSGLALDPKNPDRVLQRLVIHMDPMKSAGVYRTPMARPRKFCGPDELRCHSKSHLIQTTQISQYVDLWAGRQGPRGKWCPEMVKRIRFYLNLPMGGNNLGESNTNGLPNTDRSRAVSVLYCAIQ